MGWKVPDSLEAEVCRRIGLDPTEVGVTANQTTLVLLVYKTREEIRRLGAHDAAAGRRHGSVAQLVRAWGS